ncbi:fasciclin domain-containing protein [Flavobacteriaceae bacterium TP-CH-4]|uniref:Fasciclin domain-containing protein n=1 Tax=Pelagihabitans pacificus TaxID=2696054 RepID=A0A967E5G4_9FLAO|nr:fasciclin domain-containing protein [Pelagihabitans pacificus]NHF58054.1 fasciclin domain-containing protein [Pelagihabitans pacificus]
MKKYLKLTTIFVLTALSTVFVACSDDDNDPFIPPMEEGDNIVDLAVATADLSNLVAALQEANLVSALEAEGPFTVFAPTNAAFETFLVDNGFTSVADVPEDVLAAVLLNHIVAGKNLSADLSSGYVRSFATSGPGGEELSLYINTANGVKINDATVVTADVEATNGVVHIVDQVIGLPNIVDHATFNENLTELVAALTADGNTTFTDLLSDIDETFTVFAPVNSAFTAFDNPDNNELDNILSNHVIVGAAAFSSALTNSYATTAGVNSDGDALSLYINTDDGVNLNGVSTVAIADIVATNGVIHAVDAVIDIPTVVTFALADPNFSTLVSALTELTPATDFAAVLSTPTGTDPAPFTVFAPTNEAFAALSAIPMEDDLTPILQHHVIGGANIRSGDLTPDGNTVTPATLEGDTFTITLPGTDGNIADVVDGAGNDGIGIIAVDVQAGNGVIHVVDTVLLPDTTN